MSILATLVDGLRIIFTDALGALALVSPALFVCGHHRR